MYCIRKCVFAERQYRREEKRCTDKRAGREEWKKREGGNGVEVGRKWYLYAHQILWSERNIRFH